MTDQERALLKTLQDGFKLEKRPFLRVAKDLGVSEEEVLAMIKRLQDDCVIRRIGISVRPERMGVSANALVAWTVSPDRVEEVGEALATRREVSHCYERECPADWPYNLFTMLHAPDPEALRVLITDLKDSQNLGEYCILPTVRELKKTSMKYFTEENREG
jgi:siroheme decarboxylase